MVKIRPKMYLKINFEIILKNTHFPVFAKKFASHGMKLKILLPISKSLGP